MTQQRKPLTKKQIQIVEGKVAGKSGRDIGKQVYPNAKPETQSVMVSREIRKDNVQQALQDAFERHGITIDKAVQPIADGLTATKLVGEQGYVADHPTRLKAAGMAFGLMGLGKGEGGTINNILVVVDDKKEKYGF